MGIISLFTIFYGLPAEGLSIMNHFALDLASLAGHKARRLLYSYLLLIPHATWHIIICLPLFFLPILLFKVFIHLSSILRYQAYLAWGCLNGHFTMDRTEHCIYTSFACATGFETLKPVVHHPKALLPS